MFKDKERDGADSHVGSQGAGEVLKTPLGYKGSVSGLKGLLSNRIAEGIASVVNSLDSGSEKNSNRELSGSTRRIPIDQIFPCSDQPRQVFDPKSLEELSQTMKELGQAQAITVRKTLKGYEIISGERRFRAAKLAGLTHMDCLVKEVSGPEGRLLALVENIQRQDLLPIEEAQFLKKVLEENPSLSLEKLAKNLGSHKSTLSEKIQLTEIPEDLQPLLFARGQSFTHRHWRVISRISDSVLLREMLRKAVDNQLSVSELERSVQALGIQKAPRRKREGEEKDPFLNSEKLKLFKAEGNFLRIRPLSLDLSRVEPKHLGRLLNDLEDLKRSLLSRMQESQKVDYSENSINWVPKVTAPSIEVG